MANDSRRSGFGGRGGQNDDRRGRGGRGNGRFGSSDRDRSPVRDDRIREPRDDRIREPRDDRIREPRDDRIREPRDDRIREPRDDRMREPYTDSLRGGRGGRRPFQPRGDFGPRDPYFQEPYRRGYPDPWIEDDPYRQEPYAEPYGDPFRARAPPPSVVDCEIFVHNLQLRAYGDAVERRVKQHHGIITAVSIVPEGRTPQQLVEELTSQNALFAIFINSQNETHRSLTLNILHGTPQEHRNMPLDDAIALVGRSFFKYVDNLREKAQAAANPLPPSHGFLPPSSEVKYLLNLLADNQAVTLAEINTVVKYLEERRTKMIDVENRSNLADDNFGKSPPLQRVDQTQSPSQESAAANSKNVVSSHLELTSKIFSLFTGAGGSIQGVPPANGKQQEPPLQKLPSGTPAPPPPSQVSVPANASLINFDNPNVQKALDNLIQSTPSLLKNISATVSLPTPQMGTPSVSTSMGAMSSGIYGQGGGMVSGQPQGQMGQMQNNQSQQFLQGSFGGSQAQQIPGLGQDLQGSAPYLQGIYNMLGQGMQGHMGRGYGPSNY